MKDFKERMAYILSVSGVRGAIMIEGILKDAVHSARERGRGDSYPVNLCYEITNTAIDEIAPDLLQSALENEAFNALHAAGLRGLGSKIAEKVFFKEFDGLDAWHNGAWQVIARRVSDACAALGLEIDEDDVDASTGLPDAIQSAADYLEN